MRIALPQCYNVIAWAGLRLVVGFSYAWPRSCLLGCIVLAGTDGSAECTLPRGAPHTLARVRELIDPAEDTLILYTTGHGAPVGRPAISLLDTK